MRKRAIYVAMDGCLPGWRPGCDLYCCRLLLCHPPRPNRWPRGPATSLSYLGEGKLNIAVDSIKLLAVSSGLELSHLPVPHTSYLLLLLLLIAGGIIRPGAESPPCAPQFIPAAAAADPIVSALAALGTYWAAAGHRATARNWARNWAINSVDSTHM